MSSSMFHVCSHRDGNYRRLLLCIVPLLPLIALSLLPFNAERFHLAFRCSCLDSFTSGLKISGSDLLIYTSLHHGLQFLVARL